MPRCARWRMNWRDALLAVRSGARRLLSVLLLIMAGCASNYDAPIVQKPALPAATRPAAPSQSRVLTTASADRDQPTPAVHKVASGDKLLTIAWRYGLDVRDLVKWNQITNPDLIVVGQNLRLRAPAPPPPPLSARPPSATAASAGNSRSAPAAPAAQSKPAARISMAPIVPVTPPQSGSTPAATTTGAPPPRSAAAPVENTKAPADDSSSKLATNKAGVRWMWPAQGKVSAADVGSVTKGHRHSRRARAIGEGRGRRYRGL